MELQVLPGSIGMKLDGVAGSKRSSSILNGKLSIYRSTTTTCVCGSLAVRNIVLLPLKAADPRLKQRQQKQQQQQ